MYKTILVPVDVYETALSDKALQHAQFLAQSASGNVHLHVRSGNIRDEVIKLADELNVGAIIVGSRNPNIQTHLLGSEAASIVRYAHVPVFVIR